MDKIIRLIEEYNNSDDSLNNEFELEITSEQILFYLNDFTLNKDDYPTEIYDSYPLSASQIEKLKPFLKVNKAFFPDFSKFSYHLSCYENNVE
ncbi:hypothetical protein IF128_03305 [Empedobacter stercoris]|uniref:DUF7683 domain-containing protein n=1 Tax=Empedobacter stercoris TaxID=1628248 RepID=UPI0016624FE2|nr:hypothetical protein [Empedobacter stercoris]MCA4808780.1 hypothetical protein [Empedobacter stercoris]QNT15309.1 hypothetical protein HNV03_11980 [Empedobacter stercoris]